MPDPTPAAPQDGNQPQGALAQRADPYRAYNFTLEIDAKNEGYFTQCSGLGVRTAPIRYREGGDGRTVHALAGPVDGFETDFLALSLPEAITTSLSGLSTLAVRSPLAAARCMTTACACARTARRAPSCPTSGRSPRSAVAFPPIPRSYTKKVNKKVKAAAFRMALGDLVTGGTVRVLSGATWSEPTHEMLDFEGINGYPILLVDGAQQLYWVQTWRTQTQIGGTFYARWLGTRWSPMELAVKEDEDLGPGAHWTAAAIRLGNDIHILWNTNFTDKAGEIWHTHGVIPGETQATPRPLPSATPMATATPPPGSAGTVATAVASTPEAQAALPPPSVGLNPMRMLIVFVPLLLVVGAVLTWAFVRPRS